MAKTYLSEHAEYGMAGFAKAGAKALPVLGLTVLSHLTGKA